MPAEARPVCGYMFSVGTAHVSEGDHLGVSGNAMQNPGRLLLDNGNTKRETLTGTTELALHRWYHVLLTRQGEIVRVFLDGNKPTGNRRTSYRYASRSSPMCSWAVAATACSALKANSTKSHFSITHSTSTMRRILGWSRKPMKKTSRRSNDPMYYSSVSMTCVRNSVVTVRNTSTVLISTGSPTQEYFSSGPIANGPSACHLARVC